MGRGRDFRGPRKRGFDDDMYSPRDMYQPRPASTMPPRDFGPSPDGPALDATVKWFNSEKGFGFAEMADGSGDVFLHVAVLQTTGHTSVSPGAKLKVNVGQGQKGRQVTRVIEVDESTATQEAPRPRGGMGGPRGPRMAPDPSTAVEMTGTVKWFNAEKGFGFVAADDQGKDVFVHVSVLNRAGLPGLNEGQIVTMRVVETPKGREALSIGISR
ncbi:MAG: cold shock domain-containing protein [Alphaproteobacteria bacterium]|nr:cold shock domain-containing protein [Alphaproteobacteria bacterium]